MALRRRIGISTATTEAARRQLMQPVPCWEKVWVVPEKAAPGSTLKVLKWVKTDKVQVRPSLGCVDAHSNDATVTAIQRRRGGCQRAPGTSPR
jgi:hypothetical protein